METCVSCKHAGRPTYKSPCSECHGYSEYEAVEIRTNGDRIRAMSNEELASFLQSLAFERETPWADPFARKFCDNCPTVRCVVEGYRQEVELNECDFADGKCPHGDDVLWWLKEPVEEVKE